MRIFITGAGGFIGSHLIRLLLKEGEKEVYILLKPETDTFRIKDVISRVSIIEGDLLNLATWQAQLKKIKPDICFHLAWYVKPGIYLENPKNIDFVHATINLAMLLRDLGCKKFISTGTCFEYDTDYGYLSEDTPTKPRTLYASCKLAVKLMLEQLLKNTDMQFIWARLFYLYGPFEDSKRTIPYIICPLIQNRQVTIYSLDTARDYLYIEDLTEALWSLAQSNLRGVVNIASGSVITIKELAFKIGNILNKSHLISISDAEEETFNPPFVCANNQLLKTKTSWRQKYTLEDGLLKTIDWWKKVLKYTK